MWLTVLVAVTTSRRGVAAVALAASLGCETSGPARDLATVASCGGVVVSVCPAAGWNGRSIEAVRSPVAVCVWGTESLLSQPLGWATVGNCSVVMAAGWRCVGPSRLF